MFPRRRIAWILLASYEEVRWIVRGIPNTKCYSFMLGIWGTWWNESSGFQSSGLVCEWVCMLMNLKIILINFYLQCSRAFLSQSSKLPHSFYEPVQKVQELHGQVDHSKGSSPDHQFSGIVTFLIAVTKQLKVRIIFAHSLRVQSIKSGRTWQLNWSSWFHPSQEAERNACSIGFLFFI